jgi:hypothetical protein
VSRGLGIRQRQILRVLAVTHGPDGKLQKRAVWALDGFMPRCGRRGLTIQELVSYCYSGGLGMWGVNGLIWDDVNRVYRQNHTELNVVRRALRGLVAAGLVVRTDDYFGEAWLPVEG